jgi:hypothetical protein
MHSFEHAFRIPPHHRLEQIKTRACGGRVIAIYWDHEEYDAHGRLVARYHTFREVSEAGEGGCGWRKYDSNGCLVEAQDLTAFKTSPLFSEV